MGIPAERVSTTSREVLMRYARRYGWTGGLGAALVGAAMCAALGLEPNL